MEANKEALKEIQEHVDAAKAEISKAMELADRYRVSFKWSLSYGMNGWYYPECVAEEEGMAEGGWHSSSAGC